MIERLMEKQVSEVEVLYLGIKPKDGWEPSGSYHKRFSKFIDTISKKFKTYRKKNSGYEKTQ